MRTILILFLFVLNFSTKAQNDALQFPQDFYGVYKGGLIITNAGGKKTVGMEFHFKATDSIGNYQYMLVYIMDGKRQERNYSLITKDADKGDYLIDENNGILIEAKLLGNTLYSMFEVQGNFISTTERFYKEAMDFEITVVNTKQKTVSNTTDEEAIKVISYAIGGANCAASQGIT